MPKTFLNEDNKPLVVHADAAATFSDGTTLRSRISFAVVQKGGPAQTLIADLPAPAIRGTAYSVPVRVLNGGVQPFAPGPIVFTSAGLTVANGTGWECNALSCKPISSIPVGGQSPQLTLSFSSVPLDAPPTFDISWSGSLIGSAKVDVVGFKANAGADQTVDALQTTANGQSAPTRVILDASGSTSSVGGPPRTFTWRQISGPAVSFVANSDPSGQRVMFDAPAAPSNVNLGFEVVVTDGIITDRDTVLIIVLRTNRAPTITVSTKFSPNADGIIVPATTDTSVAIEARSADPDGDAVTITWRVPTATGVPAPTLTSSTNSSGIPTGPKVTLTWPVVGRPALTVEATATDALGRTSVASIAIGAPPAALTITAKPSVLSAPGGSVLDLVSTPSRTSGVTVRWTQVSGDPVQFATPASPSTKVTLPSTVTGPRTVVVRATASSGDGASPATTDLTLVASEAAPISVVLNPTQTVIAGATVTLAATIVKPPGSTISWSQLAGPSVTFANPANATTTFVAPGGNTTAVIIARVTVSNGVANLSADQLVNVGAPPTPTIGSGCATGSVLGRVFAGERVLLVGSASTVMLGDVVGANSACNATQQLTHTGTDINLFNFITGGDLSGTIDATKICFTSGTVRLASKFDLPPVTIGTIPLCLVYASVGGGPGASGARPASFDRPERTKACDFPFTGELRFPSDVPWVTLPPGMTPGDTVLAVDCDVIRLTAQAAVEGGGSLIFAGTADNRGGGTGTITAIGLSLFDGTVGGSIGVAYGGPLAFSGSLDIANPTLPFGDGVRLDRLGLTVQAGEIRLDGRMTLGAAEPRVQLDVSGRYAGKTNFSLSIKASTTSAWTPTPGLTVGAASISGTLTKTLPGIVFDIAATATGNWQVLPTVSVRNVSLQIGNGAAPAACTGIPAKTLFIRAGGITDIVIPGRAPLTTQVDACIGLPGTRPTGAAANAQPAFILRSLSTLPPLRPSPAIDLTIDRLELRVAYVGGELEASIRGDARVLGLGLSAKLLFRTAPTGDVLAIVATGDVRGLGTPITNGSVVFSASSLSDLEIDTGVVVDIPAGLTLVSTIDLGTAQRQLLNNVLKPPTPLAGTLVVSATLGGPDLVLTALLDLGPNGIPLFSTCPSAPCVATNVNTTSFRLDSGFITMRVGASGFQLGLGGQGTLFLPPSENKVGAVRSELQLRVEAFFRPPAEVGISFSLLSPNGWQNAAGIQGLTVNALVVQGTIDFTVPTAPIPSIGLLGEVSNLPPALAALIGFQNNGEPVRLALNISPKNPIVEISIGAGDDVPVLKPLAAIDGAATGLDNALTVDDASLVFAPLGGAIGPITYSPGLSIRFGASLAGTEVEVTASVDLPGLRIIANIGIGSFPIGGVTVNDTQLLLDIQPLGFRMRVAGGVAIPDGPSLSAVFDIQAGVLAALSSTGAPAPSTSLPRPVAGISVVADLSAASWQIVPGTTLNTLRLHGEGTLSALSGSIDLVFGVQASASILGQTLALSGDARITAGELKELHVRVNPGNISVAGVTLGGDGRCQASLVTAPSPAPIVTSGLAGIGAVAGLTTSRTAATAITGLAGLAPATTTASPPPRLGTTGPCVQLDYVVGASPPVAAGFRGTLTAGSMNASVFGVVDSVKANLQGTVSLGELGTLDVGGVLYHGADASLTAFRIKVKDEAGTVAPQRGSWRFDGKFAQGKALKGLTVPWSFSVGSVDPAGSRTRATWAQMAGSVSRPGFTVDVKGDISFSGSTMQYSLVGTSSLKVDESHLTINSNPNAAQSPAPNLLHGAIRPIVFALDPSPTSHQVNVEQVRGRLYGSASYTLTIRISNIAANRFEFDGNARILYAEGFKRGSATSFTDEDRSKWNAPLAIGIDIDSDTGNACFRWGEPGEFATQTWGAC